MKNIFNIFKLTKHSILLVLVLISCGIGIVCIKNGFDTNNHMIISITLIIILILFFIIYTIIVMCSYYKLPKNKHKTKMGVLFYINTHGNYEDYKSLKDKFFECFSELSEQLQKNLVNPIILSPKKVSVIKNSHDTEQQKKLLQKTNCLFGVFMKSTDEGRNSDEYQLQMNSIILHPLLPEDIKAIFAHNFNYVFKDLRLQSLNKTNDLKKLQQLSTQLYYVCQFTYAIANEYSKHYVGAIQLCNDILHKIKEDNSTFYKNLSTILRCEICNCAIKITTAQYNDYVYNSSYDTNMVKNALSLMHEPIKKLNIPLYNINYHLAKAVYHLMSGKIIESKGEIAILEKYYQKTPPNMRVWAFSEAFLTACENNSKKYWAIDKKYKELKNNETQNSLLMFQFLNTFCNNNPNNLGIKIAMILLVYYKDLDYNLLPENFRNDVVSSLKSIKHDDLARHIEKINAIRN